MRLIINILVSLLICTNVNSFEILNKKGGSDSRFSLKRIFQHRFLQPLDMAVFPEKINGQTWYAVTEKRGMIYLVAPVGSTHENNKIVLLDIREQVCSKGYELGLLGMAFDPHYKSSKELYIYYSQCKPLSTILSKIHITTKVVNGLPQFEITEKKLLSISQPYSNHKGGHIEFGPDGFLYAGIGDGGSAGDPHNNSQNKNSLLGKILRIDVQTSDGYKIPADNPFQKEGRGEIFAYGLRNPWRFSIDPETGWLWVGDVGQDAYEEISIVRKGDNHGWRIMEGRHCFSPSTNCIQSNLVLPVYEYSHDDGRSVIGGYVYHGSDIPALKGKYIFGDYASGKIWQIDAVDKLQRKASLLFSTDMNISSFAKDENGEIYAIDIDGGYIYKIVEKN